MSLFRPKFWKIPEITEAEKQRLPVLAVELEQRLQTVAACFPQAASVSSLAVRDMVITDAMCRLKLPLRTIMPSTGKLDLETGASIVATKARYQTRLEVFTPDKEAATAFERKFGVIAMYDSVELRRRCCHIRKIEPLNRTLKNAPAWLTDQWRSQSGTRSELNLEKLDRSRNISKFNPIFDWEESDVRVYAEAYGVSLNELYHRGYPSTGCEPCTRPVKEGENIRAGRWWWESKDSKECDLHKQNEQLRQHRKYAAVHSASFIPAQAGIRRTPRL